MKSTYRYRYNEMMQKESPNLLVSVAIIVMFAVFAAFIVLQVVGPSYQPSLNLPQEFVLEGSEPTLPWPKEAQAAVGAVGHGVLASSSNDDKAVPMASLAKVMTAAAVLDKHPLEPGEQGPEIIITTDDEALYNKYLFLDGSIVPLKSGSTITQYQLMQAMLIPSANNAADTLAIWAFGSMEEYLEYANNFAREEIGMTNSYFADASGFDPASVATASDLVLLAEHALQDPVIAEISSQWEADIPGVAKVINSNKFLDFEGNGVIGLKSGNTDEAGGTYIGAARYEDETGEDLITIAVVLGNKTHFGAQEDAMPLLTKTRDTFTIKKLFSADDVVASYPISGSESVDAVAKKDIFVRAWPGTVIRPSYEIQELSSTFGAGSVIGTIHIEQAIGDQDISIILEDNVPDSETGFAFWR